MQTSHAAPVLQQIQQLIFRYRFFACLVMVFNDAQIHKLTENEYSTRKEGL